MKILTEKNLTPSVNEVNPISQLGLQMSMSKVARTTMTTRALGY